MAFAEATAVALYTTHRDDPAHFSAATSRLKYLVAVMSKQRMMNLSVPLDQRNTHNKSRNSGGYTPSGTSSHSVQIHGEAVHSIAWKSVI